MITVDYLPGAADPVHTHNAHASVYVLEGSVAMQVGGKAPVTLRSVENLNQLLADPITLRDLYKKYHWHVAGHTF